MVEPNPTLAQNLRKIRTGDQVIEAACVAGDVEEIDLVICNDANELSSVDLDFVGRFIDRGLSYSRKKVKAININNLMEKANRSFDLYYLSIDVEGPDVEILAAIDYTTYRQIIIQIEVSEAVKPGNSDKIMDRAGYVFIAHTHINYIFIDGERLS